MEGLVTRRQALRAAGGALAASGLSGAATRRASAQAGDSIVAITSSATFEPGTAPVTSLPEMLGLLKEENLELENKSTRGSAISAQLLIGGRADVIHVGTSVGLMLPVAKGADLKAFYNMVIHNFQMPAVADDSPIRKLTDLKGKKLGVAALATSTIPIVKSVLKTAGLNPDTDITFVEVGYGAQAAAALWVTRQVDGLAMYDSVYADIENVDPSKYKLRVLSSPEADRVSFQTALVSKPDLLKSKRSAMVKLGRIIAKTTIFALENPRAAVSLHWMKYPEQRPANITGDAMLAAGERAILARVSNMDIATMTVKRSKWGYMDAIDVQVYLDMLKELGDVPKDVKPESLYTNELIDEINNFDVEKWKAYARAYPVPA